MPTSSGAMPSERDGEQTLTHLKWRNLGHIMKQLSLIGNEPYTSQRMALRSFIYYSLEFYILEISRFSQKWEP